MKKLILSLILVGTALAQRTLPTTSLNLFPEYTRDSYKLATGQDAPPFDGAYGIKNWVDPNACTQGESTVSYFFLSGTVYNSFTIPCFLARTVNLPGTPNYPARVVSPSDAYVAGPNGFKGALRAEYLSTPEEAQALSSAFTAATGDLFPVTEDTLASPFGYVYPATDSRRLFLIAGDYVAWYLKQRDERGVGYPGTWTRNADGHFVFVFKDIPAKASLPPVPTPIRPLRAGESLIQTLMGVQVQISDVSTSAPGLTFTQADRDLLTKLKEFLDAQGK